MLGKYDDNICHMKEAQRKFVRLVGSAHSGQRGNFRPCLFLARRPIGAGQKVGWEITSIPVEGPTGAIRMMGLATTPAGLVVVAGSADCAFLAMFDQRLEQTGWHELPSASDPHGLVAVGKQFWVVSSRTNEVIGYEMSASGPFITETVFQHADAEPQHFNGLARHKGTLVLSALGVSGEDAHEMKSTGYLVDVNCAERIRTGLDQPHSPYSRDGSLLFCESRTSLVWQGDRPFVRLDGYLRGLVVAADGMIHVAESAKRPSRDLLTDGRPNAALWTLTYDGHILARDTLSGVGAEIYDLVTLPSRWL